MPNFLNGSGKPKTTTVILSTIQLTNNINLDKLAHAIGVAESGNCSTSWHRAANNCWSIMSWKGGRRHLKHFNSLVEGKAAFESLWIKSYGGKLPTLAEAKRFTGSDKPTQWLNTVTQYYNSH